MGRLTEVALGVTLGVFLVLGIISFLPRQGPAEAWKQLPAKVHQPTLAPNTESEVKVTQSKPPQLGVTDTEEVSVITPSTKANTAVPEGQVKKTPSKPPQSSNDIEEEPSVPSASTTAKPADDSAEGDDKKDGVQSEHGRTCYMKKIIWQPSYCSSSVDILEKLKIRSGEKAKWTTMHIGAGAVDYRATSVMDVMGVPDKSSLNLGKLKRKKKETDFCGICCECVSMDDEPMENTTYSSHEVHIVKMGRKLGDHISSFLTAKPHATRPSSLKIHTLPGCSALQGKNISSLLPSLQSMHLLTIDAGKCDAMIVKSLLAERYIQAVKPALLEFSLLSSDGGYEQLVSSFHAIGYDCTFFTMKPPHRSFRGMRSDKVNFPIVIGLTGCWRPLYKAFGGNPFKMVCFDRSSSLLAGIFGGLSMTVHRGHMVGCGAANRPQRLKKLFP